jgi:adenylate cyclase
MLKPKQKRNLFKIIPFGLIWGLFGLLYTLLEYGILGDTTIYPAINYAYDLNTTLSVTPLSAFIIGLLLGSIEVLFLNTLFVSRPFWKKLVFKSLVYLFAIFILIMTISFSMDSISLNLSLFHPDVIQSSVQFMGYFGFWSLFIYSGVVTMLTLFISEVGDYLGGSVFNNFFTGKYHHPKEEQRIFMFLDMKASTTIAEKLGHIKYFELLNKYYADTTDAIIQTYGEVYQYAGDEIIVSWNLKNGLTENNCIRCFFMMKETFRTQSKSYQQRFDLVPEFKAGFHCGDVATGQIGTLKKEIFFTGDVLNTAARIQASCNLYETDILISENLLLKLDTDNGYELTRIGECELKGKQEKVNLFTISEK